MTSQGWIYDPPPPPPPKRTAEEIRRDQSASTTSSGSRGTYGHRGRRNFGASRGGYRQQQNTAPTPAYPQVYPPMGYGTVYPMYPAQQMMYQAPGWPQGYPPQHGMQQYYPYPVPQPPQPQPQPQPQITSQPPQGQPPQYPVKIQNPDHSHRRLPVYSTTSTPKPNKKKKQEKNALGYTISSTAYSLPEHHFQPITSGPPELSEEELRYRLEMQMKGKEFGYFLI